MRVVATSLRFPLETPLPNSRRTLPATPSDEPSRNPRSASMRRTMWAPEPEERDDDPNTCDGLLREPTHEESSVTTASLGGSAAGKGARRGAVVSAVVLGLMIALALSSAGATMVLYLLG